MEKFRRSLHGAILWMRVIKGLVNKAKFRLQDSLQSLE